MTMPEIENLIPKFEVGEKAILHYRPFEMVCPTCGKNYVSEVKEFTQIVTIRFQSQDFYLEQPCGHIVWKPDGWYETDIPTIRGRYLGVPYTLLEKVK